MKGSARSAEIIPRLLSRIQAERKGTIIPSISYANDVYHVLWKAQTLADEAAKAIVAQKTKTSDCFDRVFLANILSELAQCAKTGMEAIEKEHARVDTRHSVGKTAAKRKAVL